MLFVIGLSGCDNCRAMREKLDSEGTPYVFLDFRDLSFNSKKLITRAFHREYGELDFPVVIEDPENYGLEDMV